MITLNNINLSSIDLSGIDLRGIKLGLEGRGGGSGDGFPVLPGDVTRWHFGGLTNEMMAAMDDPRIEDADHKGRFLSFKNFAWGGMSGVGGYSDNFSSDSWKKPSDRSDITWTSSSFNITRVMNTGVQIYYFSAWEESESVIPEKRIIVKGLEDGQVLRYMNVGNRIIEISQDGIYTIPSFTFKGANSYHGYSLAKKQESCNVTVEQLPLYPGFILGDGVDDSAITEKELNFEDTYTVYTAFIPFQDDPTRNMILCGKDHKKDFYMNYSSLGALSFYSANVSLTIGQSKGFNVLCCKRTSDKMVIKNLITGKSAEMPANALIDNPGLYYLWRSITSYTYCRAAIAGQIIDNGHFSTDEEDAKVLAWHKKQYPWLFPDQAWTVTGKTNEDEDRATIANITGNGNDLVLSNFGFAEGSGYNEEGEYAGYLVTDGVDDKIDSSAFKMGEDFTVVGEWKLLPVSNYNYVGIVKANNLYVYNNASIGISIYVCSSGVRNDMEGLKSLKAICSDGRVYGEDWTEYKLSVGSYTGLLSRLYLGYNGTAYTQMAFKNLGIYNNQILSKDDCIKAYNYLQTLKAK